ncbi:MULTISPECIES: ABC transporter permease [Ruegeria]|uniref:ABC transporter permease subunit n=1 Tax=Ruegeria atlantica TaxID=81569 RepID=A0AA90Z0C6_9RHOB|nr:MULTISPECIES: ABC transporter permease [Ruegeria]NOC82155.1 ABC transporter permease subunit [Ruegeria sp. HKCCD6428]NOC90413.1 ABC transporter permease subunit [Ruegeria sp. HKCCD6604]NOE17362.1 ABC transporter permease subunit [Ruegeria atlantica]QFT72662.1 Glutathione transport system permease protein GsiD [Ruegeria sp. THAF33]
MEPLTWTGSIAFLNPLLMIALAALLLSILVWIIASIFLPEQQIVVNPDGSVSSGGGVRGLIQLALHYSFLASVGLAVAYLVLGILMGTGAGIIGAISQQFLPVWVALIIMFAMSIAFKRRLGLYGKLYDSPIGMIGFGLVMFWVFTGIFGALDLIVTHDPLTQISGMKNKVPGTPLPNLEDGEYAWYLLGGDNLARDVFSRMVKGAWVVVQIAPLATMFAFMVGITLGLPAGYYGGRFDTFLSFLANLILAFPVILLFYLLVTPEIVATGVPNYMAAVLFVFPILFIGVLLNSRYYTRPNFRTPLLIGVLGVAIWLYLSLISTGGYIINTEAYRIWGLPTYLDLFDIPGGILVVFVSVVFVNSPTVFRIVRGLALDIKTRDYVAAAQTRGEGPWYIMLWEILPNARGPLIVDFCLRIGYTTILLGTLGFFGLGLPPESPDWGSTINEGRKLLSIYLHPALPPAFALLSLVLGLNLLADGLREESLKD